MRNSHLESEEKLFKLPAFHAKHYAVSTAIFGILFCFTAYLVQFNDYWCGLLLGLGTSLLGIALGLLILNIYIQGSTERGAVKAFLLWTYPVFRSRHNLIKEQFWKEFGKQDWDRTLEFFKENRMNVGAISHEKKLKIIGVLKGSEQRHRIACDDVEGFLSEMEFLFGWTFDRIILQYIFLARSDFRRFRGCDFDDDRHFEDICESFLRSDVHCTYLIMKLLGILKLSVDGKDQLPIEITELSQF